MSPPLRVYHWVYLLIWSLVHVDSQPDCSAGTGGRLSGSLHSSPWLLSLWAGLGPQPARQWLGAVGGEASARMRWKTLDCKIRYRHNNGAARAVSSYTHRHGTVTCADEL